MIAVRLWRMTTGETILELNTDSLIFKLTFTSDGSRLETEGLRHSDLRNFQKLSYLCLLMSSLITLGFHHGNIVPLTTIR
jgi:hypothetical protein